MKKTQSLYKMFTFSVNTACTQHLLSTCGWKVAYVLMHK